MSTVSSRLGLTVPEATDSMTLGDNLLSSNYDLIDTNAACVLVSTLGSVAAPFNGMHVRNAADNKNYFRINGAWVASDTVVVGNTPLAGSVDNSTITAFTAETKILSVTFTAVAGKRYLVSSCVTFIDDDTDSPNAITMRIRTASGATVTTAGSLIFSKSFGHLGNDGPHKCLVEYFPNSSAQFTVGVFAAKTTGTHGSSANDANTNSNLWILDWGT